MLNSEWTHHSQLPCDHQDGVIITSSDGVRLLGGSTCPTMMSFYHDNTWSHEIGKIPHIVGSCAVSKVNNQDDAVISGDSYL